MPNIMPAKKETPKKNKAVKKSAENATLSRLRTKVLGFLARGNKRFILFGAAGLVIAGLAYLLFTWLVVAWVDNTPITRIELYRELEKRSGNEIIEQLVTERLVLSEAQKRGIVISENEINEEYKKVEEQVGKDMLNNLLAQQNVSEADFRKSLKLQFLVRKMFGQDINVSEQEVDDYLKQAQMPEATNSAELEKQKEQAKENLKQQKVSQAFKDFLQQTNNSSRVVRL